MPNRKQLKWKKFEAFNQPKNSNKKKDSLRSTILYFFYLFQGWVFANAKTSIKHHTLVLFSPLKILFQKKTGENPKNCQVFQDLYSSIAQLDISHLSQKTIQHALDNEKFHDLKENLDCERKYARLLSLSVRHAGAWLSAPPIPALGLHMAPNEFKIRAKYRLGVPVYDVERKCPICKTGVLDIYGDHAIACHGRGDAIARHDRIRDKIVSACSSANLSPVVEKRT